MTREEMAVFLLRGIHGAGFQPPAATGTIFADVPATQPFASWIEQLYLLPAWVGQGIGTKLLDLARAELRPPIRLYTFQANERARCFYESRGFRAIAFGDGTGNEEKCPDVLYEWRPEP